MPGGVAISRCHVHVGYGLDDGCIFEAVRELLGLSLGWVDCYWVNRGGCRERAILIAFSSKQASKNQRRSG